MALFADRIEAINSEDSFKIDSYIQKLQSQGKTVITLNADEAHFNIPLWIKEEIKKQVENNNTFSCDSQGLLSLRESIARYVGSTRRLNYSPQQVVVFPGSRSVINFALQAYCNQGDEVIYPSPGYGGYESLTKYVGAVPRPLILETSDCFKLVPEKLEALITPRTRLIILNFPSNPSGVVCSLEELEALSQVILKKCPPYIRVFSDEIYESVLFDGCQHHSIASVSGMDKKTIILGSMSTMFSWSGGRVGYAVFPTVEEAKIFKNMNTYYFSCVSPYNQEGARYALDNPLSVMHIQDKQKIFQERRDIVLKALKTNELVSCIPPQGGFYLFINIEKVCDVLGIFDAFEQLSFKEQQLLTPSRLFQLFLLTHYQVAVLDRSSFGKIGSKHQHYIRLSLCLEQNLLLEGIVKIEKASSDRVGFHAFFTKNRHVLIHY